MKGETEEWRESSPSRNDSQEVRGAITSKLAILKGKVVLTNDTGKNRRRAERSRKDHNRCTRHSQVGSEVGLRQEIRAGVAGSGYHAKILSLSPALPALSLPKGATRWARVTSPSSPAGKRQTGRPYRRLVLQWGRNDPVGGSGTPPETPYRIGRGGEL